MTGEVIHGILIPFWGTALGSVCVLFMRKEINSLLHRALTGFAAGIMVAASIWSLLLPAIEQSAVMGCMAFVPAVVGFWSGALFLLFLDRALTHLSRNSSRMEDSGSSMQNTMMLVLAVTIHNLPEGMAVGVAYAGWISGNAGVSAAGAMALALGIAIQNFPEGAIISMPLRAEGISKGKACLYGVFSGIVEPVGALVTILAAGYVVPLLPYLLSFAAGTMVYVVVAELIPEMSQGAWSDAGTLLFVMGFTVMMTLDVVLGG